MDNPMHTHYSPYDPPQQVPGTLVECTEKNMHDATQSEIFADYQYTPRLVPSKSTGLPTLVEQLTIAHYLSHHAPDTHYAITDAVRDGDVWEVVFTNRYRTNDGWNVERYRFRAGHIERVVKNPHPGYEHWPAFCPNCGY